MVTGTSEVAHKLPNPCSFKVHHAMCMELMRLVDRISKILPDLEATRPRCLSGIQSLCSLNTAIDKAKLLLQHCSDCSKLYLAFTGHTVLLRCLKARNSFEKSLDKIQSMVTVLLAAEVSQIIDDLGCATFVLESSEEEAGRVVRELLQKSPSTSDSTEDYEIKALQIAAARLNITSPKAILIEKRSIKKLLNKLGPNEPTKKMILRYLWYLLKKHGNHIMGGKIGKVHALSNEPIATDKSAHNHELSRAVSPEGYRCPISSKVMYDPVVIASGETYERMWIQKWFDEGHDTCPKTGKKLAHMSLTPDIAMKDLISDWCRDNGVTVTDPRRRAAYFNSRESSFASIRSFNVSLNKLHLPVDLSIVSLGSTDSYDSDSSKNLPAHDLNLMLIRSNDNSYIHQSHSHIDGVDLMLLSQFPDLQWDSQCKVIEDLKVCLKSNCQAFCSLSYDDFIESLIKFLNNAYDLQETKALKAGAQLLFEFLNKHRNNLVYLSDDSFSMLGNLFDSQVKEEALAIMEKLSECEHIRAKMAASSALTPILKILDSGSRELQQQSLRILYNLSFNSEACRHMVPLQCVIPGLLPFFKDGTSLRYCICMMKNLCDTEEGRVSVAKTEGCISAVVEILETDSDEEQEHALAVLLSLCSISLDYCRLVMEQRDWVIPSLFFIAQNGKDKGKASALKLIGLLTDIVSVENEECLKSTLSTSQERNHSSQQKKSSKISDSFKKFLVVCFTGKR
ncbi:U-box domain-containing protein 5-like [Prosopis cineraria]|uniref:U-box domain-containing protein 5-like n=1 Tax=Prosopis cineraria TaxID=364024 RepID=UPI00240F8A16|nr:U-box domain-containing protein 5-like [Prosopis cineraria]XP_054824292.1 U-box domain-containing protein 5-like [Prosopis cineraria]XP_054824293.1 U-box domain-containing protein 5-like [Prosopis cineraria]